MSRLRTLLNNTSQKYNYLPTTSPFANVHINLDEYARYPLLTAKQLRRHKEPPKRVRMLARDYVDDSLYNPHYGYFSKRVEIVGSTDNESGFAFGELASMSEFDRIVYERYREFLETSEQHDTVDQDDGLRSDNGERSVWHTPTELFKPWYARALARCIVANYRLTQFPYADLTIYELGAGNGTLMRGILDYLANEDPEVYERTRYHIVEVSPRLASVQRRRAGSHAERVQIHEHSALDWSDHDYTFRACNEVENNASDGIVRKGEKREKIREPVYVLAIELLDNLAHDVVRYDTKTCEAYQATITIDPDGDFHEGFSPVTDPLIKRFLDRRKEVYKNANMTPLPPPLSSFYYRNPKLRQLMTSLPFAPNMSAREFIPTRAMHLIETLESIFAHYQPIFADFSHLPQSVPGHQGPVVQTRIQNTTVPCETYLVAMGYFDIFYPTDFGLLRSMIRQSKSFSPSATAPYSPTSQSSSMATSISSSLLSTFSLLRNSAIFPFSDYMNNASPGEKMYASIGDSVLPRPRISTDSSPTSATSSSSSKPSSSSPEFFTPSRRLGVSPSSSTAQSHSLSSAYEDEVQDGDISDERLRQRQRRPRHLHQRGGECNNRGSSIVGSAGAVGPMQIMAHDEFMKEFGEVHETVLKDGSNPMVEMYSNQKILF